MTMDIALAVAEHAGDHAGERPDSDRYAATTVRRSRILPDGLKQWTRDDIDNREWKD